MQRFDVAAYLWPAYHFEQRCAHFWPEGDGEWYTVRRSQPRFPGHDQPRKPLLGYQDEADPTVMREHVQLAMEHGINVFIVDWYWYDNLPCFERQLNEGILPALEGTDCRFYLMWANHVVTDLWNCTVDTDWSKPQDPIWTGQVNRCAFEPMFDRLIQRYFKHPNYYTIDDCPVFSVFDTANMIEGIGGINACVEIFAWMRQRCREGGLQGIDLQAIARYLAGVESSSPMSVQTTKRMGFDSASCYQFAMDAGFTGPYAKWAEVAINRWDEHEKTYGTFYPHVSVGWDNTLRNPGYRIEHVVTDASPQAFETCLQRAKRFLEQRPRQVPLVTINSWNEWTEGSYLLPDDRWGYGYLQAVRNVFT